jgi:hypothetical protein
METKTIRDQAGKARPGLTSEQVWRAVARASFAVLSHVTPAGEPRSSGVVYKTVGRRLVVAVAPGSWKAQHVAADGRVAVTVLVRRGGIFSLLAPVPLATISFHGTAAVHPAGSPQARSVLDELGSLIPAERRASRASSRSSRSARSASTGSAFRCGRCAPRPRPRHACRSRRTRTPDESAACRAGDRAPG